MYKHIKDIPKCNKSINTYSLALKNKNKYNCITIKKDLFDQCSSNDKRRYSINPYIQKRNNQNPVL